MATPVAVKWFRDPFFRLSPPSGPVFHESHLMVGAHREEQPERWWISGVDIARVLERNLGSSYFQTKLKQSSFQVKKCAPTHMWQDGAWVRLTKSKPEEYCVLASDLKALVIWLVKRCRQTVSRQRRNAWKLGIWLNDEELKEPIEQHLVDVLQRVCPYELQLQYTVGKYRWDIFVKEWKMVIQIDEYGHKRSGYTVVEEQEMDRFCDHMGFTVLRFNPHAPLASPDDTVEEAFVRQVWARANHLSSGSTQ